MTISRLLLAALGREDEDMSGRMGAGPRTLETAIVASNTTKALVF